MKARRNAPSPVMTATHVLTNETTFSSSRVKDVLQLKFGEPSFSVNCHVRWNVFRWTDFGETCFGETCFGEPSQCLKALCTCIVFLESACWGEIKYDYF